MDGEKIAERYRLKEKVFSARGWTTCLALDIELGTEVEVDLVSASTEDLPVDPQRMREILHAAQRIRGPHVLPLLDWGEEEGLFYLVREKGDGPTLPELISQLGTLPGPQVVELAAAAVEVLSEAYGAGLYYLGLNPGQVFVDRRGSLRFRRVGYGWVLEDMDPAQVARVSPYRAPEVEPGREGTRASDVFSLAVMVNEVLSAESRTERLSLLLERAAHPLPARRPSSPRLLLEELLGSLDSIAEEDRVAPGENGPLPSGRYGKAPEYEEDPYTEVLEAGSLENHGAPPGSRSLRGWARKAALMVVGGLLLWLLFSALSGLLRGDARRGVGEEMKGAAAGVEVPDLQGLTLEEARERLEALGLSWSAREAPSRLWSAGRVVAQEPAAGSIVIPGETVCLVVSSGREEGNDSVAPEAPPESALPADDGNEGPEAPSTARSSTTSAVSAGASRHAARPPRAVATLSTARGPAPLYVRMDAGGSSDPDGDIVNYVWYCGDGTVLRGMTVQHVFDAPVIPARFRVVLEVSDSRGLTDSAVLAVEVY